MNASSRGFAAMDAMPAGSMLSGTSTDMPAGAMNATPTAAGMPFGATPVTAAQGMPAGAMMSGPSQDMPSGAMTTAPPGADWNMDLASSEQPCGC